MRVGWLRGAGITVKAALTLALSVATFAPVAHARVAQEDGPAVTEGSLVYRSTSHPGITTLWARTHIESRMDAWRAAASDDERSEGRREIVEDATRYRS
jgi:hypothetical protein